MARLLAGQAFERNDTAVQGAGSTALTGSAQTIRPPLAGRVGLFVCNTSGANKMFVCLGVAASLNSGIMIPPNTTVYIPGFTGFISVIGTAADVVSYVDY